MTGSTLGTDSSLSLSSTGLSLSSLGTGLCLAGSSLCSLLGLLGSLLGLTGSSQRLTVGLGSLLGQLLSFPAGSSGSSLLSSSDTLLDVQGAGFSSLTLDIIQGTVQSLDGLLVPQQGTLLILQGLGTHRGWQSRTVELNIVGSIRSLTVGPGWANSTVGIVGSLSPMLRAEVLSVLGTPVAY